MERLKELIKTEGIFWVDFEKRSQCKKVIKELSLIGYKWFNGEQIDLSKRLNFYFTLQINAYNKTIGFIPTFQRFSKTNSKPCEIYNFLDII